MPGANGSVEHAAEVDAGDRAMVHVNADEGRRALVPDHEHPVAPEHDGLASKEVNAPHAVARVSDERTTRVRFARGWTIVFRQHPVHDVLVDKAAERPGNNQRDPWATELRIA